jgi:tRNA (uracil-5-)-methyltransferase
MNKLERFKKELNSVFPNKLITNFSPSSSYRNRCEFTYQKDKYVMYQGSEKIYIATFRSAARQIQYLMPILLEQINKSKRIKTKLFQINFRTNNLNEVMVTLIYHKKISDDLINEIKNLSSQLKVKIILRSKNFLFSTSSKYFKSAIKYKNINLYQTDNCFYQPNKFLLDYMIKKVIEFIDDADDILELYCGVGTFTMPISYSCNKILASENNRDSIKCIKIGLDINNILNVTNVRLSDDEVYELLLGRKFNRTKDINIDKYNFSHVLVDPPRSGLTKKTIEMVGNFKNIIYISCNPETYLRDINFLKKHKIKKIELFDQFPNTQHLEIVSLLQKN